MIVRFTIRVSGEANLLSAIQVDDDAACRSRADGEDLVVEGDGAPGRVRRTIEDVLATIQAARSVGSRRR